MKLRPTGAYVLDSWALLAFVGDEPGSAKVEAALRHAEAAHAPLFLPVINAGEPANRGPLMLLIYCM